MSCLSKLLVAASIAMLSFASPCSAQSFSRYAGTGNVLPAYYDSNGGLHAGIAPSESGLGSMSEVYKIKMFSTPAVCGSQLFAESGALVSGVEEVFELLFRRTGA
jgi:hypothetical protein